MPMGSGELSRPPIQPPDIPSLTGMIQGVGKPEVGEGIARLVFKIEQMLDSLAAAVPGRSKDIDGVKDILRDVMTSAQEGGANGTPASLDTGSEMTSPY